MKGLKRGFYRKLTTGLLAVGMAAMLAACGAQNSASYDRAAAESVAMNTSGSKYYEYSSSLGTVTDEMKLADTADGGSERGSAKDAEETVATDRKLIKTVDMNVETRNFDELLATIDSQVKELGGYIENMDTYNGSTYSGYRSTRNASMTIRVPKDKLDAFLNTVSDVSNVVRRSDSVEDVTLQYVDLESHRDALRTEQNRLLQLLERAETIEDIITIEQRLSDVRYQLESMESQLRTMDNQVDYSTVNLSVEEVEIFTPVEEETPWERISEGFTESLDNIGEGFVEFGIWFIVHIPYFVIWVIFVAIFVLVLIKVIKCAMNPKPKKEKNAIAQNQIPGGQTNHTEQKKQ